jgi:hypothetical protein
MSYERSNDANNIKMARKHRTTKAITSDYTITLEDETLVCAATANNITITLPLLSSFETGAYDIIEFIPIVQNGYKIRIQTQGADTFPFGNTWFDLPASKQFEVGLAAHGFNLRRNIAVKAHYHRNASWSATNFSSPAAIPFDEEDGNNQSELIQWDSGTNPERVYVQTSGSYDVSFGVDIDSTGGGTWTCIAQVYLNGLPVAHADVRTGNYGNEDQSLTFIPIAIDLVAGDYLELYLDQNNLTGNMVGVTFNVSIRL